MITKLLKVKQIWFISSENFSTFHPTRITQKVDKFTFTSKYAKNVCLVGFFSFYINKELIHPIKRKKSFPNKISTL